ncbi:E3 ubiquitin-protein ligase RGLG1-like isoform X3 [Magnolia sinica]|uniref:E3 ubiquitin-protein ligase RGLG1-like isoform X3 n=1 Tax=Magnolia sinica TaxID=86752 RepID=UPI00265B09C5|nr:E3 ubiquitin-protein ligase RGLG1-like isoform X3 [Magnolia sinica]
MGGNYSTLESYDINYTESRRYSRIPNNYNSLDQVTAALAHTGLESSNLIVGIDFTKSNEWTGQSSFNRQGLHHIGSSPNAYERAISIIGRTLSAFDEDDLIPCFGFGDGPTSFAPIIETAIGIVEKSRGQYHVLLIIADGQVTQSVDMDRGHLSPQERDTISAIVKASDYPLSIVLVGVGDGPWDMMRQFDDNIHARSFDNFQFVNFTEIMAKNIPSFKKETEFALAALMEIPSQYKATIELQLLGCTRGTPVKVPLPPPLPLTNPAPQEISQLNNLVCPVCLWNAKDLAFGCGHRTCYECGRDLELCPICRSYIIMRIRLF